MGTLRKEIEIEEHGRRKSALVAPSNIMKFTRSVSIGVYLFLYSHISCYPALEPLFNILTLLGHQHHAVLYLAPAALAPAQTKRILGPFLAYLPIHQHHSLSPISAAPLLPSLRVALSSWN